MIRPTLLAMLTAIAIFLSVPASAQNVAVVDIQSAILGSEYGQQELERLAADPGFAELVAVARSLQADIDSLDSQARAEASGWDADRFDQYTRSREFKVADLNLSSNKINSERERVVSEIINSMNTQALEALEQLIEEQNISLLLQETAVYHAAETHNLTAALAEKLSQ